VTGLIRLRKCDATLSKQCVIIIQTYKDKYETCGVYEMKCLACKQVYVGQTGRDFKTRYKDNIVTY
jgi:hypothetical protein